MNNYKIKLTVFLLLLLFSSSFFYVPNHWFEHQRQVAAEFRKEMQSKHKQYMCLREALWFEARGEPEHAIRAVATVIHNRTKSSVYLDDYCAVIRQNKQFSYRNNVPKSANIRIVPGASERATLKTIERISMDVISGYFQPLYHPGVLWYHRYDVNPSWSKVKTVVAQSGSHVFLSKRKGK